MVSADSTDTAAYNWTRIALIGCCVLATVVAAMLVPTLASDELAGTPIDSVLPGERFDDGKGETTGTGIGSGFGALNPGDQTGVGGDTGLDTDTFASNDTEVHFTVESSHSAYWRTGAYGTYTGTGWERNGEQEPYSGGISYDGLLGERVDFEVTLDRSATGIPTVWQPRVVTGVEEMIVTDTGGLRAGERLEPGTTISGVSRLPENNVDILRAAGGNYPREIETRYTQLPDDTPGRVEEFASNLTADDGTAYDAAMTIQTWLRSSKGYSLNASRQSDHIADTFIFEMDVGYCEYFATAMTTMLRTQDIPARYTVGYSTGQAVGNNTYEVRGMNAHAWVEVYFPEVGWVKFDPTPGGSRLAAQSDVLEDELGENVTLEESGSPGEVFEPGEVREAEDPQDNDTDEESNGGYDISLNRTAVPGLPVEVTVTYEDEPVGGTTVYFNGEPVGTTDGDGTVVGSVPEAEELEITIEPPESEDTTETADTLTGAVRDGGSTDLGAVFSSGVGTGAVGFDGPLQVEEGANETYPIETGATVSVSGDVLPGETVTVTATVQSVAIPDATVFVDGEPVGRTDSDGRADVTLPAEPGNVSVAAERGSVSGSTELTIPALELTVDTGSLALPLGTATVEVRADDRAVVDAPIRVDGEVVASTGPDGTATVRLPLASAVTIETSKYGLQDQTTVSGLVRNLLLVVGGVVAFLVVPAVVIYRRGYRPGNVRPALTTVTAIASYAMLVLVTAVKRGDIWLAMALDRLRKTGTYLLDVVRGRVSLGQLRTALAVWLAAKRRWLRARLDKSAEKKAPASDADTDPDTAHGVRKAWEQFLESVSVSQPETRTPGELAAHAVEHDGLPAQPVRTLRDAFREVEYGSRPATDRLRSVEAAVETIERASTDASERASTDGGQEAARGDRTGTSESDPSAQSDSTAENERVSE